MKSLRSSSFGGAGRRQRSSPASDNKKGDADGSSGGGSGTHSLRRSTRDHSHSTSSEKAGGASGSDKQLAAGASSGTGSTPGLKSGARRRARGLPLRRSRRDDAEDNMDVDEQANKESNNTKETPSSSQDDGGKSKHAPEDKGSSPKGETAASGKHKNDDSANTPDVGTPPSSKVRKGHSKSSLSTSSQKISGTSSSQKSTASTSSSHSREKSNMSSSLHGKEKAGGAVSSSSSHKDKASQKQPGTPTKIGTVARERVLTAVGKNGKLISVHVLVGGNRVKSRRHIHKNDNKRQQAGGEGSNNAVNMNGKTSPNQSTEKTSAGAGAFVGNDGNLFYCYVCSDVGDVVCCDGCPHVYHHKCLEVGSASRQSLENDDDPWYCPSCIERRSKGGRKSVPHTPLEERQHGGREQRLIKHRCCECQQSKTNIPLEPCEGCGSYMHHPSCRPCTDSPGSLAASKVLCSSCRAEVALNQEEDEIQREKNEIQREKKKRKLDHLGTPEKNNKGHHQSNSNANGDGDGGDHEGSLRRRTRSMDDDQHHDEYIPEEDLNDPPAEETIPIAPGSSSKKKRNRDRDRDAGSPPPGSGKIKTTEKKKKKKKKKKQVKELLEQEAARAEAALSSGGGDQTTSTVTVDGEIIHDNEPVIPYKPRPLQGLAKATPAFFFYLAENRYKIERNLARKHRYFNRLPKGMERNELVAREAALWWIKLRPIDHRRYMNMSMRDYEQRIIEWKEEKSIHDMLMCRESDNENDEMMTSDGNDAGEGGASGGAGSSSGRGGASGVPDDDQLTYELHERLYLGTSVGSKPYKPEVDQSHNRVLLDLLRDMRFHPLPMFSVNRSDADQPGASGKLSAADGSSSKFTIPHFDVHGPFSTSVGDECLGCTRGWAHFCSVLKRRLPSVEHRAKLQPPLSSLLATRVGLGLRPQLERIEDPDDDNNESQHKVLESKDSEVFCWRTNNKAAELDKLLFVPYSTLGDPSSRADDIVQFIEEAVAMKVPEPPRPSPPGKSSNQGSSKKSLLSRGALPTRSRKRPFEAVSFEARDNDGTSGSGGGLGGTGQLHVNKCGRCRTIIKTDTGCVQCRRAQLVINMSKRQPSSDPGSADHKSSHKSSDSKGGSSGGPSGALKVQTGMLGRVMMKDSTGETQSEGDQAVASAILKERWYPCAILPPQRALAPSPSRRSSSNIENGDSYDSSDADDDSKDGGMEHGGGESNINGSNKNGGGNADRGGGESTTNGADAVTSMHTRDTEPRSRAAPARAASSASTSFYDPSDTLEHQLRAKKFKEEASELHKKALNVACCGILLALMRRDPLLLFANPVTAEGYSNVVKNPIDFGKIRSNVLAGTYQTLGAFVSDARLLCQNALAFNPPGSIYWKTAKELYDVLAVMQKRASQWMGAIRDAHAFSFRRAPRKKKHHHQDLRSDDSTEKQSDEENIMSSLSVEDPFERLRKTWPEAVDMLENSDWLRNQLAADFMRTKENEAAYYGSLAVRRVAAAAEVCLAPYPDTGGVHSIVSKRTHSDDESLRQMIDDTVSKIVDPVQLKDISTWREEGIVRLMRRVQSRRLERRIGSENGCARCDGIGLDESMKVAMSAERFGRNKKKGDSEDTPRVAASRLELTTGMASEKTCERIAKRRNLSKTESLDSAIDVCVSLRGSRIHGWGLFADQAFKKGDLVAEYVGEYVSPPVADGREKVYQEQRIQDYQFRLDDTLVIDATMNGGHGRYINHNCNPNCSTKIVPGKSPNEHLKRVLVYALRDIKPREELTYDYQFPLELDLDARIPCNCQSDICRGFMNWDLPEKGSNSHAMRTQKRGANMRDRIRRLGRPLKK